MALGLAFAVMFMARYNLTVAKVSLGGALSTGEFGTIIGWGAIIFVLGLALHGPLVDRFGGRRGILIGLTGACLSNLTLGIFLMRQSGAGEECASLAKVVGALFCVNM